MSEAGTPKKAGPVARIVAAPFVVVLVLMLIAAAVGFPAMGIYMTYRTGALLVNWQRATSWVETPATIVDLDLDVSHGDESTTYCVACRYTYEFNGVTYTGDRVGLSSGSDSIGSWHQETYNRLRRHYGGLESDPAKCWVNPAHPAEAVLDRSLRWGMVLFSLPFIIVFGGVSLVGYGYLFRSHKRKQRIKRIRDEYPDEPWRWKPAWTEGPLRSGTGRGMLALWGFAIFWNAISFPVGGLAVPDALRSGQHLALLALIFPVIGIVLLAAAMAATLRHRRFRSSRLELQTIPGVIGGHLKAMLVVGGDVMALEQITVALKCIHRVTTQRGDDSHTEERSLWEDSKTVPASDAGFGQTEMRLPVDFQIPYGCLPYDDSNPKDQTLWRLTAKSEIPGANLDLAFDVPVFRTEESQSTIGEPQEKIARIEAALDNPESPLPRKIRREQDLDGRPVFVVSAWPGWSTFILTAILSAGLLTGGGIWLRTVWQGGSSLILLPAGLCLAGVRILWGTVRSLLGSTHITVRLAEVVVERWPRFLRRRVEIPTIDIQEIKSSESAQVRSGTQMTQYYVVHLITTDGRKVKLGGMIPGEQATQWLVRQIEDALTR
jgi:hypothetical protein